MNVWSITDTGVVRQQNQDAFRVAQMSNEQYLLVVCDGMGGARAGNIASELAAETFIRALQDNMESPEFHGEYDMLLPVAVEAANGVVWHRANTDPDCLGMGTTLVAAVMNKETAHIINIGDSRAYVVDESGIRKVTRDHSLVEDLVLRGEITPEQARTHPQKNLITRALGATERAKADLYTESLMPGAFLLLCTDGLSNVVADQEILYEILHGGEPMNCCERLLETAIQRGAPDNVTAVLLQMDK